MKNPIKAISLLLLVALLASSCDFGFGGDEDGGTVQFAVSRISPALLQSLGAKALEPQSRTFLVADKVEFILYADGNYHSYWEVFPPNLVNSPNVGSVITKTLPAGSTAYSVTVYVYNLNNEASLQYTAWGSASFSVNAGQITQVDISCTPANYDYLYEGAASQSVALPVPFTYTGTEPNATLTETGSERWFAFEPTTGTTRVQIIPDPNSQACLTVAPFTSEGIYLGGELDLFASTQGESLDFTISSPQGMLCYLGVMDGSPAVTGFRGFTVLVEAGETDTPLTADGTWQEFSVAPNAERWFYFDVLIAGNRGIYLDDASDGSGIPGAGDVYIEVYDGNYMGDRSQIEWVGGETNAYTLPILAETAAYRRIWIRATSAGGGNFALMAKPLNAPSVAITGATYLTSGLLLLDGTAIDGDGVADLRQIRIELPALGGSWYFNVGEYGFAPINTVSGTWTADVDLYGWGLQEGNYVITVELFDSAGLISPIDSYDFDTGSTTIGIE